MKSALVSTLLLCLLIVTVKAPVFAETSLGFEWSYSGDDRFFFYLEQWTESDEFEFGFYVDMNTTGVEIPDPLPSWEAMPEIPTLFGLTESGEGELDMAEMIFGFYLWSAIVPLGNWTHLSNITASRTHMFLGGGMISVHAMVDMDSDRYWGFNYTFSMGIYDYEVYNRYYKADGVLSSWLLIGYEEDGDPIGVIEIRRDGTPPTITYPDDMVIESGELGNSVTWSVYDNSTGYYLIHLDDISYLNGTLAEGSNNVTISLDDLSLGVHKFNATFYDPGGNCTFDIVLVEVIDTIVPTIDSPMDLSYESGTQGHSIQWTPYDYNPHRYEIYLDGVLVFEDEWYGETIICNVDDLAIGSHTCVLIVYDVEDQSASDEVIVQVNIPTIVFVMVGGGVIVAIGVAVALKRR